MKQARLLQTFGHEFLPAETEALDNCIVLLKQIKDKEAVGLIKKIKQDEEKHIKLCRRVIAILQGES